MRVVLDTNVFVAAFIARGTGAELLEHCVQSHVIVTSKALLDEFRRVLGEKFGQRPQDIRAALALLERRVEIVVPEELSTPLCRDSDDDIVIGTAVAGRVAGRVAAIITGDKDLLVLDRVHDIPVIAPRDVWRWEAIHNDDQ